jgi:hypothetical protein
VALKAEPGTCGTSDSQISAPFLYCIQWGYTSKVPVFLSTGWDNEPLLNQKVDLVVSESLSSPKNADTFQALVFINGID